jgi:hypothetical protein
MASNQARTTPAVLSVAKTASVHYLSSTKPCPKMNPNLRETAISKAIEVARNIEVVHKYFDAFKWGKN